jgi:hypothetical protein
MGKEARKQGTRNKEKRKQAEGEDFVFYQKTEGAPLRFLGDF